ncbi:MAG: hypothetical protein PHE56_07685 [Bacteroidales bacterium]|nr:hypothetical protein [Bacteroidales bacterium]
MLAPEEGENGNQKAEIRRRMLAPEEEENGNQKAEIRRRMLAPEEEENGNQKAEIRRRMLAHDKSAVQPDLSAPQQDLSVSIDLTVSQR